VGQVQPMGALSSGPHWVKKQWMPLGEHMKPSLPVHAQPSTDICLYSIIGPTAGFPAKHRLTSAAWSSPDSSHIHLRPSLKACHNIWVFPDSGKEKMPPERVYTKSMGWLAQNTGHSRWMMFQRGSKICTM